MLQRQYEFTQLVNGSETLPRQIPQNLEVTLELVGNKSGRNLRHMTEKVTRLLIEIWMLKTLLVKSQKEVRSTGEKTSIILENI